jgi:hypothetical protein
LLTRSDGNEIVDRVFNTEVDKLPQMFAMNSMGLPIEEFNSMTAPQKRMAVINLTLLR